jgi:Protein of unknown function (DUF1203)
MAFQISALDKAEFEPFFALSNEDLAHKNARRVTVDKKGSFPCRVSLQDAEMGEEVILLNYQHLDVPTPFQSAYAIYVRTAATTARLAPDQIPDLFLPRILSLRGFSEEGMLIAADIAQGSELEPAIRNLFDKPEIRYIHLHYAKPGCYAARVDRA